MEFLLDLLATVKDVKDIAGENPGWFGTKFENDEEGEEVEDMFNHKLDRPNKI